MVYHSEFSRLIFLDVVFQLLAGCLCDLFDMYHHVSTPLHLLPDSQCGLQQMVSNINREIFTILKVSANYTKTQYQSCRNFKITIRHLVWQGNRFCQTGQFWAANDCGFNTAMMQLEILTKENINLYRSCFKQNFNLWLLEFINEWHYKI